METGRRARTDRAAAMAAARRHRTAAQPRRPGRPPSRPARQQAAPRADPGRPRGARGDLDRLRDDDGGRAGPALARDDQRVQGLAQLHAARHTRQRRLAVLTGNENRILVESEDISPSVKHAVVAIEDQRFYQHKGVDYQGIARALWADVRRQQRRPGRVDHHAAVRQERAAGADQPLGLPEAQGGGARLPARAQVDEGQDPHPVPEHRLLR